MFPYRSSGARTVGSHVSGRADGREDGRVRLRPQKRIAVAEPTRVPVKRPRFRRAVVTGCGAAIALVVGSSVVPQRTHTLGGRALLDIPALVFLILVVLCARSSAAELDDLARWRGGRTAGSAMRMVVGEFYGTVTSVSLTYVSVLTDDGILKVPNSSVLAAAVGPWDRSAPFHHEANRPETPRPAQAAGRARERTADRTRARRSLRAGDGW